MRSLSRREKMSNSRSPRAVRSMTMGTSGMARHDSGARDSALLGRRDEDPDHDQQGEQDQPDGLQDAEHHADRWRCCRRPAARPSAGSRGARGRPATTRTARGTRTHRPTMPSASASRPRPAAVRAGVPAMRSAGCHGARGRRSGDGSAAARRLAGAAAAACGSGRRLGRAPHRRLRCRAALAQLASASPRAGRAPDCQSSDGGCQLTCGG